MVILRKHFLSQRESHFAAKCTTPFRKRNDNGAQDDNDLFLPRFPLQALNLLQMVRAVRSHSFD